MFHGLDKAGRMVANRDKAGRMTKHPFHFHHNSTSKIIVRLEGQTVSPGIHTVRDAKEAYFQMLHASGRFSRNESSMIELDDFWKDMLSL